MNKKISQHIECAVDIYYLDGLFSVDDLGELESILSSENIRLMSRHLPPQHIMGIEALFAQVSMYLSSEFAKAVYAQVLASGVYDALKHMLKYIYTKVQVAPFLRIKNGKVEENTKPNIHFNVGDVHVVLPVDIDEEKYNYFVDGLFNYLGQQKITGERYCIYDSKNGKFSLLTKGEIVKQDYNKHKDNG